jgi:facilitated trehalose transporter
MFSLSVSTVSSSEKKLIAKGIQSETRVAAKERFWVVFLLALLAAANTLLSGYTLGYPSSALLDLENIAGNRSTFASDSTTTNLFGAMAPIGGLVGGAVAGWFADNLGRKITLILTVIPNIIGWTLIGVSWWIYNVAAFGAVILLGRFISGFGIGWPMFIAPVYIAEISSPSLRGLFSSLPLISLNIGVLLAYCVGMIRSFSYYQNAFVAVGITFLITIVIVWIPETPRFLMVKNREKKALQTLKLLRGCSIDTEFKYIKHALETAGTSLTYREIISSLKKRNIYLPFVLLLFLMFFRQFSGVNAVIFYAAPIFKATGFPSDSQFIALLTVGLTEVILTIMSIFVVDLFGRKILLIASAAIMCLSCAGLGISSYLEHCTLCSHVNALAIFSVIAFVIGLSVGYDFIPYIMVPEMIPLGVRGFLGGILSAFHWGCAVVVGGLYLFYAHAVTEAVAWWSFAVINLFSVIFIVVFIPETKGKKLEAMEYELVHRYKLCS